MVAAGTFGPGTGSGLQAGSSFLSIRMVYGRRSMETDRLRAIPLFQDLDDEALKLIADLATEFEEPAGWVLIEVGQPGSGMFVDRKSVV